MITEVGPEAKFPMLVFLSSGRAWRCQAGLVQLAEKMRLVRFASDAMSKYPVYGEFLGSSRHILHFKVDKV